ncbi:LysM peptidoglycan-binding domain-containing protein [Myxococcota bacterium]|nr:LysM peptidoglycan-binding domain-containing protein [Myxococcota bacterium]
MRNADGIVETAYDSVGNVTQTRKLQSGDPTNGSAIWTTVRFVHDGNGHIVERIDSYDTIVHINYDGLEKVTRITEGFGTPDQRSTNMIYDPNGNLISVTNALGATTHYGYDAVNNRTSTTNARGYTSYAFYDGANRLVANVDSELFLIESSFDPAGNIIETRTYMTALSSAPTPGTRPLPEQPENVRIANQLFDGANQLIRTAAADTSYSTFRYSSAGDKVAETLHPSEQADRVARTRTNELTSRTRTWAWDRSGRLTQFIETPTKNNRPIIDHTYDAANNKIQEATTDPLHPDEIDHVTRYSYDEANRLIRTEMGSPTTTPSLNPVQSTTYDRAGNKTEENDSGAITTYTYDLENRLLVETNPTQGTTSYTYDIFSNPISKTDALGNTTDFAFDAINQCIEVRMPEIEAYSANYGAFSNRPTTTIRYDEVGNKVEVVNPNGNASGFIPTNDKVGDFRESTWYDGNNRIIAELNGDYALRIYEYNATGSATRVSLDTQRVLPDGNPRAQTSPPPLSSAENLSTIVYEFDEMDREIQTTNPSIDVTTLSNIDTSNPSATTTNTPTYTYSYYDAWGNRVQYVSNTDHVEAHLDETDSYTTTYFDALGRQTANIDPSGFLVETAYDNYGMETAQNQYTEPIVGATPSEYPNPAQGALWYQTNSEYDQYGNLSSQTSPEIATRDGLKRVETTYVYDRRGNTTQQHTRTEDGTSEDTLSIFTFYDNSDREVAVVDGNRVLNSTAYDAVGNTTTTGRFYDAVAIGLDLGSLELPDEIAANTDYSTAQIREAFGVESDSDQDQIVQIEYNALSRGTKLTLVMSGDEPSNYVWETGFDPNLNLTRKIANATEADGYAKATTIHTYNSSNDAVDILLPNNGLTQIEYNTGGYKVKESISGSPDQLPPIATPTSAQITNGPSSQLIVEWNYPASESAADQTISWIAWDTESHPGLTSADTPSTAPTQSGIYASATNAGLPMDGSLSALIPLEGITGDIYYRVVTQDTAGTQSWSAEQTLAIPPTLQEFEVTQTSDGFALELSFLDTVANPLLLLDGQPPSFPNQFTDETGNRWSLQIPTSVPNEAALSIQWETDGTVETTEIGTPLRAPGDHQATGGNWIGWPIPTDSSGLVLGDSQWVLYDGFPYATPDSRIGQSGGDFRFETGMTTPGTNTYTVFYGTSSPDSHTGTISAADGGATTTIDLTLSGNEATHATNLRVAWREVSNPPDASPWFPSANEQTMTQAGSDWNATLSLAPSTTYEIKLYYTGDMGETVLVQWERLTTSTSSDPTVTQPFEGSSMMVLAQESAGSVTLSAIDQPLSVTPGDYSGPIDLAKTSFEVHPLESPDTSPGQQNPAVTKAGYSNEYEYNHQFQLTGTNENTGVWKELNLDAMGNTVSTRLYGARENLDDPSFDPIVSFTQFDRRNLAIKAWGPETAAGRSTATTTWDYAGNVASKTLPGTQTAIESTYDGLGNLVKEAYAGSGIQVADASYLTTVHQFKYDAFGNQVSQIDANGNEKLHHYGPAGGTDLSSRNRLTKEEISSLTSYGKTFRYDSLGRTISVQDNAGHEQWMDWDQRDRLIQLTDAIGVATSDDDSDGITKYWYDPFDRKTWTQDANGNFFGHAYDTMGNLTNKYSFQEKQGEGPKSLEDALSAVNDSSYKLVDYQYAYDIYGNKISETTPTGSFTSYTWNSKSKLTSSNGPLSNYSSYTYDDFGRIKTKTNNLGQNKQYTYDNAGNITKIEDLAVTGIETKFKCTPSNEKPYPTENFLGENHTVTHYEYDLANRRTKETFGPNSGGGELYVDMAYVYWENGWLKSWKDSAAYYDDAPISLTYQYDQQGNKVHLSGSGSTQHSYAYDAANRVTTYNQGSGQNQYFYNSSGWRDREKDSSNETTSYTYDQNGRITNATATTSSPDKKWTYDSVGNVATYQEADDSDASDYLRNTYKYYTNYLNYDSTSKDNDSDSDKNTNFHTTTDYDLSQNTIKVTQFDLDDDSNKFVFDYRYEAPDASGANTGLLSNIDASGGGTGSSVMKYDQNGNLKKLNRDKSPGSDSKVIKTFVYNADDQIIRRTWDSGDCSEPADAPLTRYLYANGNPVGEYAPIKDGIGGEHNLSTGPPPSFDPGWDTTASLTLDSGSYSELKSPDSDFPSLSIQEHTVREGETLQSISGDYYGNPSLWFVLAEANGLRADQDLAVGNRLVVPNTVENGRMSFDSHVIYDEDAIIGPKLPEVTPPSHACQAITALILGIIAVIASIALTVLTAGAAAETIFGATTILATAIAYTVVGAISFLLVDTTKQIIMKAAFRQNYSWNWKETLGSTVQGAFFGLSSGVGALQEAGALARTGANLAFQVGWNTLDFVQQTAFTAWKNDENFRDAWKWGLFFGNFAASALLGGMNYGTPRMDDAALFEPGQGNRIRIRKEFNLEFRSGEKLGFNPEKLGKKISAQKFERYEYPDPIPAEILWEGHDLVDPQMFARKFPDPVDLFSEASIKRRGSLKKLGLLRFAYPLTTTTLQIVMVSKFAHRENVRTDSARRVNLFDQDRTDAGSATRGPWYGGRSSSNTQWMGAPNRSVDALSGLRSGALDSDGGNATTRDSIAEATGVPFGSPASSSMRRETPSSLAPVLSPASGGGMGSIDTTDQSILLSRAADDAARTLRDRMRQNVPATFSSARLRDALVAGNNQSLRQFQQSSNNVVFQTQDIGTIVEPSSHNPEYDSRATATAVLLDRVQIQQGSLGSLSVAVLQGREASQALAGLPITESMEWIRRIGKALTVSNPASANRTNFAVQ